jgi:hypothetical protein
MKELTLKYSKVSSLKEAQIGWENEYEVSSKQVYIHVGLHSLIGHGGEKQCRYFNFTSSHILTCYFCCQCMHGPNCKKGKLCSVGSRIQQVNVLGGVIFPIWGNILKAISKKVFHQPIKRSCERTYLADAKIINSYMLYQFVTLGYPLYLIILCGNRNFGAKKLSF